MGQGGENFGDLAKIMPLFMLQQLARRTNEGGAQFLRAQQGQLGSNLLGLARQGAEAGPALLRRFFGPQPEESGLGVPFNRETPVQDASSVLFQGGRNEREGRIKDLSRDEKIDSDLQKLMERIRGSGGVNKAR